MGTLPGDWTLPALTPFNEAWFTSGAIAIQRCTKCGTLQHPPDDICHVCGSMEFDTATLAPSGTVASYTVIHYAAHPALADSVPYVVALVSLDEAPHLRVVGNLDTTGDGDGDAQDGSAGNVRIGMPVEAYWVERTDADGTRLLLPQWKPRIIPR